MVKAKEGTSSAATTPGPGNAPRSAIVPSGSKKDSKKSTAKVTITEPIAASAASLATTVANADKPTLNRVSLSPTSNLGSSTHTLSASESTAYLEIDPTLKDRTGLREEELRELIEIFSLVDVDHGGTISTDELETLMKTVGLKASQDELEIIVKELDTEGTGEIDFESFVVGMSRKVQTNLTVEDLSRAFRIFERFEVPHDQTVKKPKDPVETKTTEDGETDHDHLGGIIPTALVAKILTDYGDIDKRMLPREAEDIIASVRS
ncbi:hypothetical protein HK101_008188 [Irineochytrium annulatum]|nr:hypothetical protein HK101_008188 [Irineochytrium annulatum]